MREIDWQKQLYLLGISLAALTLAVCALFVLLGAISLAYSDGLGSSLAEIWRNIISGAKAIGLLCGMIWLIGLPGTLLIGYPILRVLAKQGEAGYPSLAVIGMFVGMAYPPLFLFVVMRFEFAAIGLGLSASPIGLVVGLLIGLAMRWVMTWRRLPGRHLQYSA